MRKEKWDGRTERRWRLATRQKVDDNQLEAKVVRGRENVPAGDNFAWWSCHFEYRSKDTCEAFILEQLQEKYSLGFGQQELWNIIERDYTAEEVYVKNVNHPNYNEESDDIVFED